MKIELGGGLNPLPDADVQLDPVHGVGYWRRKAEETPWPRNSYGGPPEPMSDGCADLVYASHVLEHIPAGEPRLRVFNEAHRVLRSGGTFMLYVPLLALNGKLVEEPWAAIADPTHVSFWAFPHSLHYFTGESGEAADYGIKKWKLRDWGAQGGWNGYALLEKP